MQQAMDTEIRFTLLHLSLIQGVGAGVIEKLVKQCADILPVMYQVSTSDLIARGFGQKTAQVIVQGLADKTLLDQERNLLDKHHIQIVTVADLTYPTYLKNIFLPPPILYVQGAVSILTTPSLGVVGSRKATSYGKMCVEHLLPPLVHAGITIVSGGAYGIDAYAHRHTLELQGITVAVLGSGLLRPYPRENKNLFEHIVQRGGAIISPFALQAEAQQWTFPVRNRIIAGLSQGTLVVQAAASSGALITARYALDENRQVFAVPGSIFEEVSAGCHALLQEGAILVKDGSDILKEWGMQQVQGRFHESSIEEEQQQEIVYQHTEAKIEDPVLYHLATPISLDELIQKTGKPEEELKELLFDLQLEGRVEQDFAGLWQKS